MKEWVKDIEHSELQSPEAMTWLDKYDSVNDALAGGFSAVKKVGEPFKLPESLEALEGRPDGKAKVSEFKSQVNKLMGAVEKEEDLADINFSEGLADARNQNPELVEALKKWGVGKPKNIVAEVVKFINTFNQGLLNTEQNNAKNVLKEVAGNLATLYGGEKAVQENYELVRRMFQNDMGLTADEYNKAGKDFVENVLMKNTVVSKGLMNLARQIGKEGTTEPPGSQLTGKKDEGRITKKDGPTGKALGWDKK